MQQVQWFTDMYNRKHKLISLPCLIIWIFTHNLLCMLTQTPALNLGPGSLSLYYLSCFINSFSVTTKSSPPNLSTFPLYAPWTLRVMYTKPTWPSSLLNYIQAFVQSSTGRIYPSTTLDHIHLSFIKYVNNNNNISEFKFSNTTDLEAVPQDVLFNCMHSYV